MTRDGPTAPKRADEMLFLVFRNHPNSWSFCTVRGLACNLFSVHGQVPPWEAKGISQSRGLARPSKYCKMPTRPREQPRFASNLKATPSAHGLHEPTPFECSHLEGKDLLVPPRGNFEINICLALPCLACSPSTDNGSEVTVGPGERRAVHIDTCWPRRKEYRHVRCNGVHHHHHHGHESRAQYCTTHVWCPCHVHSIATWVLGSFGHHKGGKRAQCHYYHAADGLVSGLEYILRAQATVTHWPFSQREMSAWRHLSCKCMEGLQYML